MLLSAMLAVFQIGGGEILVIALVALIVVGPDQLPSVMRRAGQYVNQLRAMTSGIRDEFMAGVDEIDPNNWANGQGEKPVSKPVSRGDGSANNPIVPRGLAEQDMAGTANNPFASQAPASVTEAEVAAAEAAERVKIAKKEAADRAEAARAAARERLEAKKQAEQAEQVDDDGPIDHDEPSRDHAQEQPKSDGEGELA